MNSNDRNHPASNSLSKPAEIDDVIPYFLKLPTENIVVLKFLLESYEGFGELRTLNREKGEVVILAAPDLLEELQAVLASAIDITQHREIAVPQSCKDDWLLSELLAEQKESSIP